MTAKPDIPPEAVTNAEAAIYQVLDRWGYDLADYGSDRNRRIASEAAVEALTASAGLIAAKALRGATREQLEDVIRAVTGEVLEPMRAEALRVAWMVIDEKVPGLLARAAAAERERIRQGVTAIRGHAEGDAAGAALMDAVLALIGSDGQ